MVLLGKKQNKQQQQQIQRLQLEVIGTCVRVCVEVRHHIQVDLDCRPTFLLESPYSICILCIDDRPHHQPSRPPPPGAYYFDYETSIVL